MQHRVKMVGSYASDGLLTTDLPTLDSVTRAFGHVDGHLQRGRTSPLTDAGLQHPQPTLLDGEFGVAHVGVVALEALKYPVQIGMNLREVLLHVVEVFGVANARHNVFALSVNKEVAVRLLIAS